MSLETIKLLRSETGAGMVDVKQALDEALGDTEKARELLRKKGLKIAAKKQMRIAGEGLVHAYIHPPGKIGALVTLSCETDFVARNEEFKELAHEIAKQIVAMSPVYIKCKDVPEAEIEKEKIIYQGELKQEDKFDKLSAGNKDEMIERIVKGKMQKYYEQVCLLEQTWISDDSKKIKDLITEKTAKLGEKIEVREFIRFEL